MDTGVSLTDVCGRCVFCLVCWGLSPPLLFVYLFPWACTPFRSFESQLFSLLSSLNFLLHRPVSSAIRFCARCFLFFCHIWQKFLSCFGRIAYRGAPKRVTTHTRFTYPTVGTLSLKGHLKHCHRRPVVHHKHPPCLIQLQALPLSQKS